MRSSAVIMKKNGIHPTEYPQLNQVLEYFVVNLKETLNEKLVGAYLQGSYAAGDYDPHSDVDFVVVVEEELSADQVDHLQAMHRRIFKFDSPWAQSLDGSYIPRHILRRQDMPDEELWYLDNGHSSMVMSTHCNTLVVRWVLREHGVTLAGPAPETLLDPDDVEMLRKEIFEVITRWGEEILQNPERYNNRFYQSFIVLSFCRMLYSLHTGRVESKPAGAAFAKANLDPRWNGLIDRTWTGRHNPSRSVRQPANPVDFEATLDFIRFVAGGSDQLLSR
jgi:predicted nucleotidyltransferase